MEKNRIIIIALMAVIIILLAGMVVMMVDMNKEHTNLKISDKDIVVGNNFAVKLTDANGNPIPDETVHVKITDNGGNSTEKVLTTDSKGNAKLKMDKKGKYSAECKFEGNGQYKPSSADAKIKVEKAATAEVNGGGSSSAPAQKTISLELTEFDKLTRKTSGKYTVEAEKWRGSSVGGFEVFLYKNGQQMDRYSYESRAYFKMDGEWKWSNWDSGEASYNQHRYPVTNDVEIKEVEVRFYD